MKERPILFNAPMVRAILEGKKTQTRRISKYMNMYPPADCPELSLMSKSKHGEKVLTATYIASNGKFSAEFCPFGQIGDQLWVRETHFINHFKGTQTPVAERPDTEILYRATVMSYVKNMEDSEGLVWKPSIHMPRWASRIQLEITRVRVERLKDINEADAIAEGCAGGHGAIPDYGYNASPDEHFMHVWASAYGEESWHANPWVWVIEFRRVK
jgi:hypothetical protein